MGDRDFEAALAALKRIEEHQRANKPIKPATASGTLQGPDPSDPSYVDHTKRNAVQSFLEDDVDPLAQKVRDKAASLDWRDIASKGLKYAGQGLGYLSPMGAGAAAMDLNSAASSQYADRDNPPTQGSMPPGTKPGPQSGAVGPQNQVAPPAQANPESVSETPLAPLTPATQVAGQMPPGAPPRRAQGGPASQPGMGDLDRARLMAGDVGVTQEMSDAIAQAHDTMRSGMAAQDERKKTIEADLSAEAEARRNVAFAEQEKAKRVNAFLQQRMADEERMRAELSRAAVINPNAYMEQFDGVLGAAMGAILMGFGNNSATRMMAANINANIDRNIDAQVKTYQNKLGMSRELRAQWDARMASLGDIEQAKLSAKIQDVDMAKSYFAGHMNIAKTDDAKQRIAEAANALDMKSAELRQQMAQTVAQSRYKLIHEREVAARAAAARQNAQQLEAARRHEDMAFKSRMLDKQLQNRIDVAGMRGPSGTVTRGQSIDAAKLAKQRAEIDPMIEQASRVGADLEGVEGDSVPGYGLTKDRALSAVPVIGQNLMSSEGVHNQQLVGMYTDMVNKAITGATATDREQLRRLKNMIASGDREAIMEGIQNFNTYLVEKKASINAGYDPSIVSTYEQRRQGYRAGQK